MQSSTIQKIFSIFSNMKNMTRNIQNGFLDMKMGSRILRIMGVAKWAVFPEGGGQQFSGTVKGGGRTG